MPLVIGFRRTGDPKEAKTIYQQQALVVPVGIYGDSGHKVVQVNSLDVAFGIVGDSGHKIRQVNALDMVVGLVNPN